VDSLGIAVLLGIVEGLTEFIPVSSTGHLILVGHLLGFVGDKAASFEVAIQLGAILAVVVLYRRRFIELVPQSATPYAGSTLQGWSGIWRIVLATLPALIVGFFARHTIKEQLFTPLAVTWALAVGGVIILLVEKFISHRHSRSLETLTLGQALGVGLFQVLALWPGTSRAAATSSSVKNGLPSPRRTTSPARNRPTRSTPARGRPARGRGLGGDGGLAA